MIKCVIVDDEILAIQYLKLLCEQIEGVEVIRAFNNPEKFLAEKENLEFNVCLFDIEMPGINGLQLANLLDNIPIIFTTAYRDFAVDAFDLEVIDYLIKPIQKERLEKAFAKILKRELLNGKQEIVTITLNSEKGKSIITIDDIFYITVSEFDSRDKILYFKNSSRLLLKNISFEKMIELLPKDQFCRINKKEVLALSCVNYFSHDEIVSKIEIENRLKTFSLGDHFRNDFVSKL